MTHNQLLRENNQAANKTWVWEYDNAGNITSRKEYAYTTGTLGTVVDTVAYTYGDTTWGDLMTTYDGNWIHYDGVGNPDTDGTWDYTWRNGRELASMSNGSTTWTFTYNADGIRTKRTDGTTTYVYTYNGSTLTQLDVGSNRLFFVYDGTSPTAVVFNNTTYYYVTNLQGDIIAILNGSGTKVVEYTYDAWGNILSTTGSMASTLGVLNPLRYRGYVYDTETGLYYLQSRYYDPEMGRFINADAFPSTGQGLLGNNMFAYCNNNPVMGYDPSGYANGWGIFAGIVLVAAGIGCIVASGGAATPAGAALLVQAGVLLGITGAVTTSCAAEESVMVMDVSVSDPVNTDKKGVSLVIDFEDSSFDLYGHYGYSASTGGSPVTYSVGRVYNYENSGDYSDNFVNMGGSAGWFGVDYCRSPDLNPDSCNAKSFTFGLPGTKGMGAYAGADYFYQIGYWEQ